MRLFGTMQYDSKGSLEVGGCSMENLAKRYGTPLYIIDEEHVRRKCKEFKESFSLEGINTEVIYASKAMLNIAMCKLIEEEGLSLDVVSGGELFTALKAEFPAERIFFHGNNKSTDELRMALGAGIGRIVADSFNELELLEELCRESYMQADVLLRINPGISAHTHKYIQTSKNDSKFGESIYRDDMHLKIAQLAKSEAIKIKGLHYHIGSQIMEASPFYKAAANVTDFIEDLKNKCGVEVEELNLGGGFGVYYSGIDTPIDIKKSLAALLNQLKSEFKERGLDMPKLLIEPGRAVIANAGTTLYTVGSIKETYGGKKYVFVDGGMTDNVRTAMYDAKYEAAAAFNEGEKPVEIYTVAGKCCESGDIIIKDIELPRLHKGDLLAVMSTGAYNYSMSSNYNRIPKPAMVFVKDGKARLAVQRESYEDLVRNDMISAYEEVL
ncbi:MAG: diaminopimelate decarboxylase [Bacillota bacterium]